MGGSQGSQVINDTIMAALPELLDNYQVIHQTGRANQAEMVNMAKIVLKDNPHANRYHPFDFLDDLKLRMAAGAASVIVSRAGSVIFEIALWGVPSIIIPIPEDVSHDQTTNAQAYARSGSASIINQNNLSSHVLIAEINRIVNTPAIRDAMKERTKSFARADSADVIANALLDTALEHEK